MKPFACAKIVGNEIMSNLYGNAYFYKAETGGIWIEIEVGGLPTNDSPNYSPFYGMHIHEVGNCTLTFEQTGGHFNPTNEQHPNHAGDLPPLLNSNGYAYSLFYTNRLNSENVLNKSLVIHSGTDDFKTQPSGDSGQKMGCGVIEPCKETELDY